MMKKFCLQWHITDRCDQRCKHCYIYGKGDNCVANEMNIETMKYVIQDFVEFCKRINMIPYLAITGGDPLLHPDFWSLMNIISHNKIDFSILGNPFHIDKYIAKDLKRLGCSGYQMSLDGTKEIHDYIRKKGSYDETLKKINILNDCGIKTSIMVTVSRMNATSVPLLVPEVIAAGAKVFSFARYCPNKGDEENMLTFKEYRLFLEDMWNVYQEHSSSKTKFIMKDHLWKLFMFEKGLIDLDKFSESIIYDGCHCAISHMTLLPNGDIYACRRFESKVGEIQKSSFFDVFFSEEMNKYRNYQKFEACGNCELLRFCRGCPAVSQCVNNDFYSKDPQCWHDELLSEN